MIVHGCGELGLGEDVLFNGVAGSVGMLLAGRVCSCGGVYPDLILPRLARETAH